MAKISHRIEISAPRARVFNALSTTEGLKSWYTPQVEGEVGEGQEAMFRFTSRRPFRRGFAEITPESQVRWECVQGPGAAPGTTVTFRLFDAGTGTAVECDHADWPEGQDAFITCNTLRGILMGHLKDYAETAKPAPAFH